MGNVQWRFDLPAGIEAPAGRGPVSMTDNIPKAHNAGFEIDGVLLVTDSRPWVETIVILSRCMTCHIQSLTKMIATLGKFL